jgi:diacylglycerol kinase
MNYEFMKERNIFTKLKYAVRGIIYLWQNELSWRWQVAAAVVVQVLAWYFDLSKAAWAIITLTSVIILSAEAFNTVLERLLDIIEPRLSNQVGVLKNLLAAAVLLIVLGAVVIALLVII